MSEHAPRTQFFPLLAVLSLLTAAPVAEVQGQRSRQSVAVADSLYQAAIGAEQRGDLAAALGILGSIQTTTDEMRRHIAKAQELSHGIAYSRKQPRAGRALLQKIAIGHQDYPALHDIRDQEVGRLNHWIGLLALKQAQELAAQGDFEAAADMYRAIRTDTLMPDALVSRAIAQAGVAALEQERRTSGAWTQIRAEVSTAFAALSSSSMIVLLLILTAWFVVWVVNMLPKRGAVLDVADLTADESNREFASRMLAEDIQDEINKLSRPLDKRSIDGAADLEGFATIRAAPPPLGRFDGVVSDAQALKVGGISFSPRQILEVFAAALRRPYRSTLKGQLTASDGMVTVRINRVDVPKSLLRRLATMRSTEKNKHFRGVGVDRRAAICDFARRYAFEYGQGGSTTKYESFDAYNRALDLLRAPPNTQIVSEARDLLQSAVRHDPDNWVARFKCAEVLRKLNDNRGALAHFKYLKKQLQAKQKSVALAAYLKEDPDFEFAVDYNIAVTRANDVDIGEQSAAIEELKAMRKDLPPEPQTPVAAIAQYVHPAQRERAAVLRRQLLIRSGLAAACASMTESLAEEGRAYDDRFASAEEQVNELCQWIDSLSDNDRRLELPLYAEAKGIISNARGRVEHHRGNYTRALEHFREAVSWTHLVDAYIGIAATYFKTASPYWPRNQQQIEAELQRAIAINPASGKAYHYLGRLELARGNADQALAAFSKAEEHPWTLFLHATVLGDEFPPDKRKYVDAIELLDRSISMRRRADERYHAFGRYVIAWHNSPINGSAALRDSVGELTTRALALADELAASGTSDALRQKGLALKAELEALRQ